MSVMGFRKKKFGWGVGGSCELYPRFVLYFWNFLKPLSLPKHFFLTAYDLLKPG